MVGSTHSSVAAQVALGLGGVQEDFWAQRIRGTEKWRTRDPEEAEPKGKELWGPGVGAGRGKGSRIREGGYQSLIYSPPNTHLGLAPHWVRCPDRWSTPGTAAAERGGPCPSYFVDHLEQGTVSMTNASAPKERGNDSLPGLRGP